MSGEPVPPTEVLSYWLGDARNDAETATRMGKLWWGHAPEVDAEIRARFGPTLEAAASGQLESWTTTPRRRLALIILLDQMSRNAYRDTPRMYAQDARALAQVREAIDDEEDLGLDFFERVFLYMPLMHTENLKLQRECCARFETLAKDHRGALRETAERYHGFAVKHRDIIERFGRFPHRNAILGRESTPEELAFLAEPGSSF